MRRVTASAAAIVLLVLIVLVIPQLVLPGIAAQQLRDRLKRFGPVQEVKVDAFPAVELLWHHADRVVIRMPSYVSSAARLSSTLSGVGDTGSLDASARRLVAGLLTLHNARLQKRGSRLVGSATVSVGDLRASFPILDGVRLLASTGRELTLQGTATVFGVTATADATVRPQNGGLVVTPDVPFGGLATISLFSNPRVAIEGVAASPYSGGFVLTARAWLR